MKMSRIVSLILVAVMILSCLASCNLGGNDNTDGGNTGGEHEYSDLNGTYNIKMFVSELTGVDEQFQAQIDAFEAKYPGIIINAEITGLTEADAGSMVVSDVLSAPDIYCFAQDQLARLVQANALAKPITQVKEEVKNSHDAGSVAAASIDGEMYPDRIILFCVDIHQCTVEVENQIGVAHLTSSKTLAIRWQASISTLRAQGTHILWKQWPSTGSWTVPSWSLTCASS